MFIPEEARASESGDFQSVEFLASAAGKAYHSGNDAAVRRAFHYTNNLERNPLLCFSVLQVTLP